MMGVDLTDYETSAREAVMAFWGNRETARQKQRETGILDQGDRAGVTAGKNMDGFAVLVANIVRANGLPDASICCSRQVLTLPGYFRPTKVWDMLIVNRGRLVGACEFKSQVGSFGNNFNNRAEEVIGSAVDLWTAYREGAFGDCPRPFLGWLMLLEDCPQSRAPVRSDQPHFKVFPEFQNASYAERYNVLCRKLVQEQLYSTSCLMLTPRSGVDTGDYSMLSEMTSLKYFVSDLAGHIASEAARTS